MAPHSTPTRTPCPQCVSVSPLLLLRGRSLRFPLENKIMSRFRRLRRDSRGAKGSEVARTFSFWARRNSDASRSGNF